MTWNLILQAGIQPTEPMDFEMKPKINTPIRQDPRGHGPLLRLPASEGAVGAGHAREMVSA